MHHRIAQACIAMMFATNDIAASLRAERNIDRRCFVRGTPRRQEAGHFLAIDLSSIMCMGATEVIVDAQIASIDWATRIDDHRYPIKTQLKAQRVIMPMAATPTLANFTDVYEQ